MAERIHRPGNEEYWIPAWSRVLFSGDVFEAIPFGDQPTTVLTDIDAEPIKHYLGGDRLRLRALGLSYLRYVRAAHR